jgi:hypothetical protein
MKINYAIVSADDSYYLDYWPIINKGWSRIGIEAVLVRITGKDVTIQKSETEFIITLSEIPEIKTSLQAQLGRLWAYKMLQGNLLMSDIDMLPLSETYFTDIAAQYNETQIISYSADAKERFGNTHAMCYILANNKTMSNLIKYNSWEEFVTTLAKVYNQSWHTDQIYLTKIIDQFSDTISLTRGFNSSGVAHRRLDRVDWPERVNVMNYFDCHLPKPYRGNEIVIEQLLLEQEAIDFIGVTTDWSNHRTLLYKALQRTTGRVVEFGCGEGSTPALRKYCEKHNREFLSFESNQEWASRFDSLMVKDWDDVDLKDVDLLFIDHAPGERRWKDIRKYANIAKVIVIHDSEPHPGYMLDRIWSSFPYRIDCKSKGAWTTIVSNTYSETEWR